jgi:hypothetical protein
MVYVDFFVRRTLTHICIHEPLHNTEKSELFLDCEAPALMAAPMVAPPLHCVASHWRALAVVLLHYLQD